MDNIKESKYVATVAFSNYQIFIVIILSLLQFTVVLDFMVIAPLGEILLKELQILPYQFGIVVSVYSFSAGISGLLSSGFSDKYDRKKMLLLFYIGFIIGTVFCAIATTYEILLVARVITGIFGGVISAVSFSIITDLFIMKLRGRVMGFVQVAFSASQILGIPLGLLLADKFDWHIPFWSIAILGGIIFVLIFIYMNPIKEHLKIENKDTPFEHLWKTMTNKKYLTAFLASVMIATDVFMLMPFGSVFITNNLKIPFENLPLLYVITGMFSIMFGPFIGSLCDRYGKFSILVIGSLTTIIIVSIYTNMEGISLWLAIAIHVVLFLSIISRMISSSALLTAIPMPQDRGAFMSINSSFQQLSGGISSIIAGLIVVQTPDGTLLNYGILGFIIIGSTIVTIGLFKILNNYIKNTIAL